MNIQENFKDQENIQNNTHKATFMSCDGEGLNYFFHKQITTIGTNEPSINIYLGDAGKPVSLFSIGH